MYRVGIRIFLYVLMIVVTVFLLLCSSYYSAFILIRAFMCIETFKLSCFALTSISVILFSIMLIHELLELNDLVTIKRNSKHNINGLS